MRKLSNDFSNPNLFTENRAGEYQYGTNSSGGRFACGSLKLTDNVVRDGQAQVRAGGASRRMRGHNWGSDDGGHLIGARFGGSSGEENLVAQNSNYNRSDYKHMESQWAMHLEKGDKVFVYIDTDALERPNTFMGYVIYESSNGERTMETFYHTNESRSEIAKWEDEYDEFVRENPEWDIVFDEEASKPPILEESELQSRKDDYLGEASENKSEVETETTEEIATEHSTEIKSSASDYLGEASENKSEVETETTEEKAPGRSSKMESSADNYLGEAAQMETTSKVSSIESGRSISGGASSSGASSSGASSSGASASSASASSASSSSASSSSASSNSM